MFDDKDFGVIFPTRTGTPAGTAQERTMLESVGTQGFRTKIVGNTMLRTRNGRPEFSSLSNGTESRASLSRGFCCRHYTYIPIAKVSDPRRIDYAELAWTDKEIAKVETPTRYSITTQYSDKTGYADVIGYADGLCVNGVKRLTTTFSGTPFLLTANLDVVAVTDDSVVVGREKQVAEHNTSVFKNGLSPALDGTGSSHTCRVTGDKATVHLFGGYMTDLRRLNYDITVLASPVSVAVLSTKTDWFNDGGNVRLVDYDADPQTSSTGGSGEWRDPPSCVPRTSPGLVQFTYKTAPGSGPDTWDWERIYVQTIPVPTKFDNDPSNWYDTTRYNNTKELKETVVAGPGLTLHRTATATVTYERTRSQGWAWSYHYGSEEAGTSIGGGYYYPGPYGHSIIGVINCIAHGSNSRYINTASTTQNFVIEGGASDIPLVSATWHLDSNLYSAVVDTAATFDDGPFISACSQPYHDMGSVAPDYDVYWLAYGVEDSIIAIRWEYGKTENTFTSSATGEATVRDYLYYDADNGVELWLEFKGQHSGPDGAVTATSSLVLCANIFGTESRVLLAQHEGHVTPASLEVDFIYNEGRKPTYAPINHCPCVFSPPTHQGAFEYIAYMTKAERLNSSIEGIFYLSLPLFVTREPPAGSNVPTPDFPALTVIPKNIEAFVGRFGSTVLTSNGTKVAHVTAVKSGAGWALALAWNTGRHETAWRY